MTKWTTTLLALVVLVAVSVHASPITNDGATNKVMARQEGTAPSAEVVVTPVTSAPVAPAAAAEEEDDDDDDDDDDYDLGGGIDDDDDDDDDEAEDDDDDDDDYIERFFDDILADDDDDDDEKPAKPSTPAVAEVTSAPAVVAAVTPEGEGNAVSTAADDDYDEDDDEDDEDQDDAASETEEQQRPALGETDDDETDEDDEAAEKDEGDEEDEEDDDNDLASDDDDDDDDEDLLDSDEDDDIDVVSAKSARALGAKAPKMPAAHLSKYNRFVDSIIGRINEVLKKSFDPVTVRLTRGSPPPSRRPTKNDPKHNTNAKIGEEGPTYELVAVSRNEDLPLGRSSTDNVETPAVVPARRPKHARRNKNKSNKQSNRQRARATLIGLASLRRDGDVTVNSMSEHTTVRSRFLLGPLVLRVEKQFGRGAKKELRSATATTDKMTGRMVLRVNSEGVAKLHSIRVLQPKQVRVESEDDHDRTREFVWRRSSHIASLVSQKLTKAARDLLQTKPEPAERQ